MRITRGLPMIDLLQKSMKVDLDFKQLRSMWIQEHKIYNIMNLPVMVSIKISNEKLCIYWNFISSIQGGPLLNIRHIIYQKSEIMFKSSFWKCDDLLSEYWICIYCSKMLNFIPCPIIFLINTLYCTICANSQMHTL